MDQELKKLSDKRGDLKMIMMINGLWKACDSVLNQTETALLQNHRVLQGNLSITARKCHPPKQAQPYLCTIAGTYMDKSSEKAFQSPKHCTVRGVSFEGLLSSLGLDVNFGGILCLRKISKCLTGPVMMFLLLLSNLHMPRCHFPTM